MFIGYLALAMLIGGISAGTLVATGAGLFGALTAFSAIGTLGFLFAMVAAAACPAARDRAGRGPARASG
jgi:hypothetical protein